MKIIVLLSASLLGFGIVSNESVQVKQPAAPLQYTDVKLEEPMLHVTLDTVEIVASKPVIAANY
ncbi:hypothetical protein [Pontibacter arcticus]|uniref:Uncharacterized protein n=1 Tax=Pontibacter arcticus TaxID=2080288 RepID=A0A364RDT5_9BACT|nr:hypothetical protein [Pontibacter arcticus]RAU82326.1 hypothetical protein DP923_11090 [Pontibacter arcticus]